MLGGGFRVEDLGFRVWVWFGVESLGLGVKASGSGVQGSV